MNAGALRAAFDAPEPLTIGLEEEVMLLDPGSLDLAETAAELLGDGGDAGLKLELPASQLEIVTAPAPGLAGAIEQLAVGRRRLAALVSGRARPAVAGVHPFAAPLGALNAGERYDAILRDHGDAARSQLVCALQVHVAAGSADGTLAIYNALRGHLPELAALAANAPFHAGRDTGFASIRPLICTLLPRQGVPPVIGSWAAFADMLQRVGDPGRWWWELRPHPAYGTLELRVCDAQTSVAEAAAVVSFAHALVAWLAGRHAAGETLGAPESWRIAENRWEAARHGLDGHFADLDTGARRPVRDVLRDRLDTLAPVAARLGCGEELASAHALVERNGALRQREVAAGGDLADLAGWLAGRFLSS